MDIYASLIDQYQNQIVNVERRIEELKVERRNAKTGMTKDLLSRRIVYLEDEVNSMYDSINMMKKYAS